MSLVAFILSLLALGIFAGFFAGLLGLGGGIFMIPGLVAIFHAKGFEPDMLMHLALGTSLGTVFCIAFISMRSHQKHKALHWPVVWKMIPGLMVGGYVGAQLAGFMPTQALMGLFSVLLLYVGVRFVLALKNPQGRWSQRVSILLPGGLIIGTLAAMLGLGGGVFIVPFLSKFDLEMRDIMAISSVCLMPPSFMGMLGYMHAGWHDATLPQYALGYVYWPAVLVLVFMSLFFVPLGVRMVHKLPQATTRKIFGVLLLVMSVKMGIAAW